MTKRLHWRHSASLLALMALVMAILIPTAAYANGTDHCPDHDGHPNKVEGENNDTVLPAGTEFCVKASNEATGTLTADGTTSLIEYVESVGIVNGNDNPHDVSYYLTYDTSTPPADVCPNIDGIQESIPEGKVKDGDGDCVEPAPTPDPAVSITTTQECGVATITVTTTDIPDHWQYGVTVKVDDEIYEDNLVKGVGTDTITVNLDEDQSDGEATVTYYVTDATEWDLIDENLQGSAPLTLNVDTDCEEDDDTADGGNDVVEKVEICHATASPKNPYVVIEPAVEGVLNGHADEHTGPIFESGMDNGEWGDIIPSFTYVDDNGDVQQFDGLNWDAEGQAVFDADCTVDDLAAAAPGLTVTKTADVDTVSFDGDDDSAQVTYTYTIANTGNVALELTAFDDDKIADIDLDDLDAVLDGALAVDGNVTVEYTATLTSDDFDDDGELTNVVTVTGLVEGANPDDADNTVTDTDDETVSAIEDGDEPPVEVEPDFIIDVPEGDVICIGTDVTIEIEALLDGDETVDVDDLELDLRSDLDLSEHGLDADDLDFDEDGNFSATLSNLPLGTNVIDYEISLDGAVVESNDISVTVIACPPAPETPGDGEDDDGAPDLSPTVELDADLVCPDGDAGFVVTTTATDVEVTEGLLAVAFSGSDTPFWSGDIELGEALDVAWPVGTDDLPLAEFTVWVAFGDVTSESMVLNADDLGLDCEDVLGEVIDQPDESDEDVTGDSPDTPDTDTETDADTDADADVVREDDEVLGVVLDDSDDDLGADQLARTGVTVFGLLAAGLLSLLAGAGLLRRRDDA